MVKVENPKRPSDAKPFPGECKRCGLDKHYGRLCASACQRCGGTGILPAPFGFGGEPMPCPRCQP